MEWKPRHDSKVEGRVVDGKYGAIITIYSEDISAAMGTLRHELVDYITSNAIRPYLKAVSALLSVIGRRHARERRQVQSRCWEGLVKTNDVRQPFFFLSREQDPV